MKNQVKRKAVKGSSDELLRRRKKKELRDYVESLGGNSKAVDKWTVNLTKDKENKIKVSYSKGGKRFRYRTDVARFLQLLSDDKKAVGKSNAKKTPSPRSSVDPKEPREPDLSPKPQKPLAKKPLTLLAWQRERIEQAPARWRQRVRDYMENGYTIFRKAIPPRFIKNILHHSTENIHECNTTASGSALQSSADEVKEDERMVMRKRKGNQAWMGAIQTIDAHIKKRGATETVISPLATREPGRYDMPLPAPIREEFESLLREVEIMDFALVLCKTGRIRAQDIMLSRPGSVQQPIHTDSSWDGKASTAPRTHYLTILIPLTRQDTKTGGTRVWPKSHRSSDPQTWDKPKEMIEPTLKVGDALVFDGLLSHQGMANVSKSESRYFYYAAFSSSHDPNTDVTGH